MTETTALGAACLAGLAAGMLPDLSSIESLRTCERLFLPDMDDSERRQRRQAWKHAVASAIAYGHPGREA